MVVLWIPNSLTSLANFSFSLNLLKTCPWWYATFIIPSFFVLIISSYRLIIFAAFSGSCTSSASLFKLSNSRFSSMIIESSNRFFISSLDLRFVFLLSTKPFHIYKQKINTLAANLTLKQKCLSRLIFLQVYKQKITSSAVIPSFSHSSFKVLSINLFVSGNVLLTAFKTAKTIFTRFLSILIARACSLIFKYSALCLEKYPKLFYSHSWYMILNMVIERWLVFKISKYCHETLRLVFKIFKHCPRALWSPAHCIKYSIKPHFFGLVQLFRALKTIRQNKF